MNTLHRMHSHLCRIFPQLFFKKAVLVISGMCNTQIFQQKCPVKNASLALSIAQKAQIAVIPQAQQSHFRAIWSRGAMRVQLAVTRGHHTPSEKSCVCEAVQYLLQLEKLCWKLSTVNASGVLHNKSSHTTHFSVPMSRRKMFCIALAAKCVKLCLSSQPQAVITKSLALCTAGSL